MKVILRQDVPNLGDMGEMVDVKCGYARNYLIAKEMAFVATEKSMKAIEQERKRQEKRSEKEKSYAEEIVDKLQELQVTIPMKVGEEGRLYGSVTPQMIADELSARGFDIDRRNIVIEDAIKSLGVFDVKLKLHQEVSTTIKIWVIEEE